MCTGTYIFKQIRNLFLMKEDGKGIKFTLVLLK